MKLIKRPAFALLTVMGALALAGCGQMPPLNFSVPNVGLAEHRLDAEVRSVTVTLARPDEQIGEIDIFMAEMAANASGAGLANQWHVALQEALNRSLIFRDGGSKTVSIAVKVMKLSVPDVGFSFTTEAVARYEVIDRANGDIIFSQDVSSSGTTPMDYAFNAAVRTRESINRAVQNNIALFLQATETIDLAKPMFPADSS